ncbi:MAG: SDR family oxidoreductase [Cyanobacteriota bacterium]|jgi:short-subunit dehydrogenase
MNFPLQHQRALVTGASSGIGRAIAIALAQSGCSVALVGRSLDKLDALAAEIEETPGSAQVYCLDLSQVDTIGSAIQPIINAFGVPDILVNSAGIAHTRPLLDTSLSDWRQALDLNLTSVFEVAKAVLPGMRSQGRGTILNIASVAARQVFPNWGLYCVTKAALVAFSQALALEERPHGIRVTVLSPGSVNTPLWDTDTVDADFDRSLMLTPDIVAQAALQAILLPPSAVITEMTLLPSVGVF